MRFAGVCVQHLSANVCICCGGTPTVLGKMLSFISQTTKHEIRPSIPEAHILIPRGTILEAFEAPHLNFWTPTVGNLMLGSSFSLRLRSRYDLTCGWLSYSGINPRYLVTSRELPPTSLRSLGAAALPTRV